MFDFELCACKLHVDVARRAAEYAARAAEEEEQRERGEREAKGEEETDPTELAVSNKLGARVGINIEIPDGPIQSERAKDEDTLPAGLPPPPAPAPVKPAPWAAHKDGASPNPGADQRFLENVLTYQQHKVEPTRTQAEVIRQQELVTMQRAHVAGLSGIDASASHGGWHQPLGGFGMSSPNASRRFGLPPTPKTPDSASQSIGTSPAGMSARNSPGPPGLKPGAPARPGLNVTAPRSMGGRVVSDSGAPTTPTEDAGLEMMEARLAAVMFDELDSEIFGANKAPAASSSSISSIRQREDSQAHSAWLDAQAAATQAATEMPSPGMSHVSSCTSLHETAAESDLWDNPTSGDAFGGGMWGGNGGGVGSGRVGGGGFGLKSVIESEESSGESSAAAAPSGAEGDVARIRSQLDAALEGLRREQRRADQAEARAEGLQIQNQALQEAVVAMRGEQRAKHEEFERLRDEHLSSLRTGAEAKRNIASMCEQLEMKDHELGALHNELSHQHNELSHPQSSQGMSHGPGSIGSMGVYDHGGSSYGNAPHPHQYGSGQSFYPMRQVNGSMMGSQFSHQQHVQQQHVQQQHVQQQVQQQVQQMKLAPQSAHQAQAPPPGLGGSHVNGLSQQGTTPQPGSLQAQFRERAAQIAQLSRSHGNASSGGWKCAHCTFVNTTSPVLDPQTQGYKGSCEMCEGITPIQTAMQ